MKALLILVLLCLGLSGQASAHETTRSYLTLTRTGADVTAALRIAFRDIEVAVWIDENLDGKITWDETGRRIAAVSDYVTAALTLDAGGTCPMIRQNEGASEDGGIAYLELTFQARCPSAQSALRVTSRLFQDFDPDHRLFLTADLGGEPTTTLLGPDESSVALSAATVSAPESFLRYFREGVRHLLAGADHLVFLLVLILPAAAIRGGPRKAVVGVLMAVTGFTLAHALTLTAAATTILRPPSALIETLIAASIVLTAIDNLRPFIPLPRAAVAAFFGLIHGFGFATALGGLTLSGSSFVTALIGFNLGIEAAQIGVVMALLPALLFLGHGRTALQIGSFGAAAAGLYWIFLRVPLL